MKGDAKLKYGVRWKLPDGSVNPEWNRRALEAKTAEQRERKKLKERERLKLHPHIKSEAERIYARLYHFRRTKSDPEYAKKNAERLAVLHARTAARRYEITRRWAVKNRIKVNAAATAKNWNKGPQPCSILGCPNKAERHHPDYSKPREIVWLCRKHHKEEHANLSRRSFESRVLSALSKTKMA